MPAGIGITNKQKADHRNRMFQQGHLTRRQDPLWGKSEDVVLRAHTDTFHVTNRAPQVGFFNMGTNKRESAEGGSGALHWRALEDYALVNARADRARVTVFTGPMFDDKKDYPWSRGVDGMQGFKVPREYWKIVMLIEEGELRATALVIDQTPLIDHLPELFDVSDSEADRVAFGKVKKYHYSIEKLARRVGIDFGDAVIAADTYKPGAGGESKRREVQSLADIIPSPRAKGRPKGNRHQSVCPLPYVRRSRWRPAGGRFQPSAASMPHRYSRSISMRATADAEWRGR